jgi:hypothetical protein
MFYSTIKAPSPDRGSTSARAIPDAVGIVILLGAVDDSPRFRPDPDLHEIAEDDPPGRDMPDLTVDQAEAGPEPFRVGWAYLTR